MVCRPQKQLRGCGRSSCARVRTHTQVLREGSVRAAPVEEIVPGDIVLLSAGRLVPADAVIIQVQTVSLVKQFLPAKASHREGAGTRSIAPELRVRKGTPLA